MKRFYKTLAVVMAVALLLCFAGCKKDIENPNDNSEYPIDIAYYLSVGQIKEAEFSLGTKPEEIENAELSNSETVTGDANHEHGNEIVKSEGNVSYHYSYGAYEYYYNKGKEDKGISFIASFDEAYGFFAGSTTKYEVKNAITSIETTERDAEDNELFFMMFDIKGCKVLSYKSGKYELNFYFNNDVLLCTTICNTENWSLKG